jgi:predicted DNA-binding transcriptional regulator AlpA
MLVKQSPAEAKQHNPEIELLTEKQVSKILNVSLAFLRRRRSQGTPPGCTPGPVYLKLGKSVRYRKSDIVSYLEEHICEVA